MGKEIAIQSGRGGFLRGSVDYFFQKPQDKGLFDGSVAIVQPIEKEVCSVLEQQGCEYNLFLRGIDNGQVVGGYTYIDVISRCANPYKDFEPYMRLMGNLDFRFIVSNTTEAGIEYMDSNQSTDMPARSFLDKLTQLSYKRFRLGPKGSTILSCELIGHDGEELEEYCLCCADLWRLGEELKTWLIQENDFCSALVDRIITGLLRDEHEGFCRRVGEQDNMVGTAEIFHLWVIQGSHEDELPLQKTSFHAVWTNNVDPYKKRKVRILNGARTFMMLGVHSYDLKTAGECLKDEKASTLLCKCIFGEIIPAIDDAEDNQKFGEAVLGRFSNPFIRHMFLSIALNSVSRFRVRVLSTISGYRDMSGSCPQGLTFSLVALITFYRTDDTNDSQEIMDFMKTAPVEDILERGDYWGRGLSPLLGDMKKWYELIKIEGMSKAYDTILSETE